MRHPCAVFLGAALTAIGLGHTASAATATTEIRSADIEDASALALDFDMLGANVTFVRSDDPDLVVRAVVHYRDEYRFPPVFSTNQASDGTFTASFAPAFPKAVPLFEGNGVEWEITLGGAVDLPLDLSLAGIAVLAPDVDLGGLPLRSLAVVGTGLATSIDFSTPTTTPVEQIAVAPIGGVLVMQNIGNTDFADFAMAGAGALSHLDFRGEYSSGPRHVGIIGAGHAATLILPSDVGERVSGSGIGLVVGFDPQEWKANWTSVETLDYTSAPVTMDLELAWQLGAAFIIARLDDGELGDVPPPTDADMTETWQASLLEPDGLADPADSDRDTIVVEDADGAALAGCNVSQDPARGAGLAGLFGLALMVVARRRRSRV